MVAVRRLASAGGIGYGQLMEAKRSKKSGVPPTAPTILTVREVSEFLRIHPTTIYRLVRTNQIPGFRVGSDWRFNSDTIDRWMTEQQAESKSRSTTNSRLRGVSLPKTSSKVTACDSCAIGSGAVRDPGGRGSASQSWQTFLRNHAARIASIDLFAESVIITVGFRTRDVGLARTPNVPNLVRKNIHGQLWAAW